MYNDFSDEEHVNAVGSNYRLLFNKSIYHTRT